MSNIIKDDAPLDTSIKDEKEEIEEKTADSCLKSKSVGIKNRIVKKRPNVTSAFHRQTEEEGSVLISKTFLKEVQKCGFIKLAAQGLHTVPEKLWKIQDLEVANTEDQYRFDRKDEYSWWNMTPISHLDLSSNTISEISKDIQNLQDLKYLNLHDNCLTTLPEEIGNLKQLIKLDISRNKFTVFTPHICKLVELTNLNISHNQLTQLHEDFTELIMLEYVDLSENRLTKLPRGMGFLIRLIELNLSHNELRSLPPHIVNLRDLKKLDISYNCLNALPDMGELRSMEYLYANNNRLTNIPSMAGCNNLKECYFGFNEIKTIHPDMYYDLKHLKTLDIPNNKLEEIPEGISTMQSLSRLNLQNNYLTCLPNTLCLLPHLQTLTVEGNKFRSLRRDIIQCGTSRIMKFLRERYDSDIETMHNYRNAESKEIYSGESNIFPDRFTMKLSKSLKIPNQELTNVPDSILKDFAQVEANIMDISKNNLIEVPAGIVWAKEHLTELNLSINKLIILPDFLSECIHLKYINLSKNQITEVPQSYGALKELRELNLSNNKLNEISNGIYDMQSLELLNLSNNQVTYIDAESLMKLKKLAVLDLMNNSISQIPPSLGNMKQLRTLELAGNCFRQPSHAVLQKGIEHLLSYLRNKIPV